VAAKSRVAGILRGLARNGIISESEAESSLDRVDVSADLEAVSGSTFVFESIPENLEWKRALFKHLDRLAPPETVRPTNTSSFSPAAIGEGVAHPERSADHPFSTTLRSCCPWSRWSRLRSRPKWATDHTAGS